MCDALPKPQRNWALFLDVDGTLAPMAPTPSAVVLADDLPGLLETLHEELGSAVALVSGRSIADLDRLFAPARLPAAGQYGAELRGADDVPIQRMARCPALTPSLERLRQFAATRDGLLIEDKGISATAHYRNAPLHREQLHRLLLDIVAESGDALMLRSTRLAFELIPPAANKRHAVEWFMSKAPFRGRVPVFIGDDQTDEDGFAAALHRSGHAIRVGLEGDSIASSRIATPDGVRQWLHISAAALSEG